MHSNGLWPDELQKGDDQGDQRIFLKECWTTDDRH